MSLSFSRYSNVLGDTIRLSNLSCGLPRDGLQPTQSVPCSKGGALHLHAGTITLLSIFERQQYHIIPTSVSISLLDGTSKRQSYSLEAMTLQPPNPAQPSALLVAFQEGLLVRKSFAMFLLKGGLMYRRIESICRRFPSSRSQSSWHLLSSRWTLPRSEYCFI